MIELVEAYEDGDQFIVRTKYTKKRFFRSDYKEFDEQIFNTRTGATSQNGLIRKGSLLIAMHEYFKKYNTYGIVPA